MRIRKNQRDLTNAEWDDFLEAYEAARARRNNERPRLVEFVRDHNQAMTTLGGRERGVHTMMEMGRLPASDGRNFLAWHRAFLACFEQRLRRENSRVTIPYWNAFEDPYPERLLEIGRVNRSGNTDVSPDTLTPIDMSSAEFLDFQTAFELGYHDEVHRRLGGVMTTSNSPRDPVFWLHHCYVDYIYARWQEKHGDATPDNGNERFVADTTDRLRVRDTNFIGSDLNYSYDTGIGHIVRSRGQRGEAFFMEADDIILLQTGPRDFAKIRVYATSKAMASLIVKVYRNYRPVEKVLIFVRRTSYYDLNALEMVPNASGAEVKFTKSLVKGGTRYKIEALGRVKIHRYRGPDSFDELTI